MALKTGHKLVIAAVAAVAGAAAYFKFAEAQPFVAGLGLGAGVMIFGPTAYNWAFEAAERIPGPPARIAGLGRPLA